MIFVDGENLSIRYKNKLKKKNSQVEDHVHHEENVYVWSDYLTRYNSTNNRKYKTDCSIIRSYYYTCAKADEPKIQQYQDDLIGCGITDPRVFKKRNRNRSKRVDITLSTDMLTHSFHGNYDIAVLVAGDEDYVPLVQEVKRSGKQVALWFFKDDGLSSDLKRECDSFLEIDYFLCNSAKNIENRL